MSLRLAPYDVDADHVSQQHAVEFDKLVKAFTAKSFHLLIVLFNQQYYRDLYLSRLGALLPNMQRLYVEREGIEDVSQLKQRLHELAEPKAVIHVLELPIWQVEQRQQWIRELNHRREALAMACPATLVLWLDADLLKQLGTQAPDLWSWRSGIFDFTVQADLDNFYIGVAQSDFIESTELERRRKRIAELSEHLQNSDLNEGLKASLLVELGDLYTAIGELNEAMDCFQQAFNLYLGLDDESNVASSSRQNSRHLTSAWTTR
jgi:tetratricopeptide (TPR) repeat protein